VTLEEQMICGTLQTLNEEAYEDVASSERPSPTGEMLAAAAQLQLAPIRESSEFGSPSDDQMQYGVKISNHNNNNNNQYLHAEYNRSVSSHSLQSLSTLVGAPGGGGHGHGGSGGDGLHLGNGNDLSGSTLDLMHVDSVFGGGGGYHRASRQISVSSELLHESSSLPMVVVIPNASGEQAYDDTKL